MGLKCTWACCILPAPSLNTKNAFEELICRILCLTAKARWGLYMPFGYQMNLELYISFARQNQPQCTPPIM